MKAGFMIKKPRLLDSWGRCCHPVSTERRSLERAGYGQHNQPISSRLGDGQTRGPTLEGLLTHWDLSASDSCSISKDGGSGLSSVPAEHVE